MSFSQLPFPSQNKTSFEISWLEFSLPSGKKMTVFFCDVCMSTVLVDKLNKLVGVKSVFIF